MAFDENLADRILAALIRKKGIEEKKMFGGLGFLLYGNILVGVWKPHVGEFDITGKAMKGWGIIAAEGVTRETAVNGWVQRAVKFVAKLPAK